MLIHDETRRYTIVPRHNPIKERTLKTIRFSNKHFLGRLFKMDNLRAYPKIILL